MLTQGTKESEVLGTLSVALETKVGPLEETCNEFSIKSRGRVVVVLYGMVRRISLETNQFSNLSSLI